MVSINDFLQYCHYYVAFFVKAAGFGLLKDSQVVRGLFKIYCNLVPN